MKVRAFSWFFAALWMSFGALSFVVLPRFRSIFNDLYDAAPVLPPLTRFVFFMTPLGWLVFACTMAGLLIYRDISGKRSLFPDWAALFVLVACAFCLVVALFLPLIVDVGSIEPR